MRLIAHRGNLDGRHPELENAPVYVLKALELGFEVEIDVWQCNSEFWLGHDIPTYTVNPDFFKDDRIWCHAKNLQAFESLMRIGAHCFWHQNDDITLTSRGYVWTYPGKELIVNSICLALEPPFINWYGSAGVCSDHIIEVKRIIDDR